MRHCRSQSGRQLRCAWTASSIEPRATCKVFPTASLKVPSMSISTDADDNPVIQTAVVGHASVLCTLDRHFRQPAVVRYCAAKGIRVLTDIELLQTLRGKEQAE